MASITKISSRYSSLRYFSFLNAYPTNFKRCHKILFHCSSFLNVKGQRIIMPSLSPTMSEGKIVKWLKKEGDTISPGDVLCDIETDKAVVSFETEEEGILAKIIVPENTNNIKVGTLIALMVSEGEDWKQVELEKEEAPESSRIQSGDTQQIKAEEKSTAPVGIQIKMPSLSPTMMAGSIVKWYKKEGEAVAAGDVLCEIQTDKAVISYESDEDGILAKIIKPDDSKDIKVGELIAIIVSENEDWKNVVLPKSESAEKADKMGSLDSHVDVSDKSSTSYGPAVRALLSVYQIQPDSIKATGRNNLLLKEDVLKHISDNKLERKPPKPVSLPSTKKVDSKSVSLSSTSVHTSDRPNVSRDVEKRTPISKSSGRKPEQPYVDIEVSNIRRVIAKRLTESKYSIPHAYCDIRCQVDDLINLRKEMTDRGIAASMNDYIIKAAAYALKDCPKVNVISVNNEYVRVNSIDISVAVATPNGLITPIVQNAQGKTITEITQNIRDLALRAREGKLKPHEFQGGSFTISNLGMFGIKNFTAIINPPQIAILAVGSAIDRCGLDKKTHKDMIFTLSYDRRALQEDEAAEFLHTLKNFIENPKRLVASNISVARSLGL